MGKPTALVAAEWADLLAFAAHHTGLRPRSRLRFPTCTWETRARAYSVLVRVPAT